ncbi:GNAT family N-acetyltransferase [Kitasatospora sp. YST-16]|uniref:GNAT family N-acetyltransferase n=1 Tax=Kitasatospora sp. YST-16 TaxID=2998080 RepID=UPI0022847F58|nr:GNAT family N-acetyltransferase [Kitasatospora sp. YST-16]WAL73625.1 GNAT family N-acetyltransferase [Kitasatospora sp. YST-16]WNW39682.1 GNAT family N-acetyltransferase [Streptomyces sp. Li-HN-5-13]
MGWTLTTSLDAFRTAAGAFLAADPVENTVLLTILDRIDRDGPRAYGETPPEYGWWCEPDGTVTGATLRTPPYGQRLGRMGTAAAEELARALADRPQRPEDAGGGRETVFAFAAEWARRTGLDWAVASDERLYRLGELTPPPAPPAGRPRPAAPADRELVAHWLAAFCTEAGISAPGDVRADADQRIAAGTLLLWEAGDGRTTALAGASPAVAGMSRIGPVYTPPEHRGHGYASALTAAASARARAGGAAEVLLYTDLANPTSNAIYQRIGYVPVGDAANVVFR